MKPIIGISADSKHDPEDERSLGTISLNWNYAQAISDAGGVPIVIPPTADPDEVAKLIDGWLIPGGADIDPVHWCEPKHSEAKLADPRRFDSEAAIFSRLDPDVPVLGICYGCQLLNVVRGGSLIQHLPDVVPTEHTGGVQADYAIDPESLLARAVGTETMSGKSYHHQAIGELGEGLRTVARHVDGTVEAVEGTDRPWLVGVQWHPERTMDDPTTRRLFEAFVKAAAEYRGRKLGAAAR